MNASVTQAAAGAHLLDEVPGADRLRGRTRDELADALTWLAWYAQGIFTAVMDYMDYCDDTTTPGEPPARSQPAILNSPAILSDSHTTNPCRPNTPTAH